MKTNISKEGGGLGFCGNLTIAFIVLKLVNVINWSWWWVLAPLWIPLTILAILSILRYYIRRKIDKI